MRPRLNCRTNVTGLGSSDRFPAAHNKRVGFFLATQESNLAGFSDHDLRCTPTCLVVRVLLDKTRDAHPPTYKSMQGLILPFEAFDGLLPQHESECPVLPILEVDERIRPSISCCVNTYVEYLPNYLHNITDASKQQLVVIPWEYVKLLQAHIRAQRNGLGIMSKPVAGEEIIQSWQILEGNTTKECKLRCGLLECRIAFQGDEERRVLRINVV